MKKRAFIVAVACMLLLALSSCGKDNKDIKSNVSEQPSASTEASATIPSPEIPSTQETSAEPSETTTDTTTETAGPSPSTNATVQPTEQADPTEDAPSPSEDEENYVASGPEFSFITDNVSLTLRERNIDAKLKKLPFNLVSDETEVLGEGSDTFTGSYIRTIAFDGFEITMFAPKDNSDNFWILQMTAMSNGIETNRGVKVGDSVEKLLQKYPEAVNSTDGSEELYIYAGSGDDAYAELVFKIADGAVAQMTTIFFIP